jgi:hypothetical protein
MKHLLFFIFIIPIIAFGQTNLKLKVKLIDFSEDKIPAYCGYIAYATTLKFELIENYATLKKGQEILLIICCPRDFGIENYINQQAYDLTIFGDSEQDKKHKNYGWSIWYQYKDSQLPTYWSKELKIIK